MQPLIIITLFLASQMVSCVPAGVTVGLSPHDHPIQSLYHAQDKFGQYVYGFATPTSSKSETKTADGVTRGGYSYIDSNGYLQTVEYSADPVHGFRVAATNLPKDLPDVVFARAKHIADYEAIKAEHAQIGALKGVPYSNPVVVPYDAVPQIPIHQQVPEPVTDLPEVVRARNEHLAALQAAYAHTPILPQPVQDLPEVVKARLEHLATVEETKIRDAALRNQVNLSPIPEHITGGVIPLGTVTTKFATPSLPIAQTPQAMYTPIVYGPASSQFRTQDDWGQYSYGYVGPLSSHSESRTADGVTRGGYSYIDANGVIQTVHYTADAKNGFRVAATNIPVDPNHVRATPVIQPEGKAAVPAQLYNHEIVY